MSRLDIILPTTLGFEGGYSNNPKDPGGATNKGITQRVYDAYRSRQGLPQLTVQSIKDQEVYDIYLSDYFLPIDGPELGVGIDLAVFDYAVNSGVSHAVKALQKLLPGVDADGAVGSLTLDALQKADPKDVIARLTASRLAFVKTLDTYATFGNGWDTRITSVSDIATNMVTTVAVAALPSGAPNLAVSPPPVNVAGNAKALTTSTSVVRSPLAAGALSTMAGAAGQTVLETAKQVYPHVGTGLIGALALIATSVLFIGGGTLVAYSGYRKLKDTGITFKELFQ